MGSPSSRRYGSPEAVGRGAAPPPSTSLLKAEDSPITSTVKGMTVFRRATLTRLSGGSASKIDPLNL